MEFLFIQLKDKITTNVYIYTNEKGQKRRSLEINI